MYNIVIRFAVNSFYISSLGLQDRILAKAYPQQVAPSFFNHIIISHTGTKFFLAGGAHVRAGGPPNGGRLELPFLAPAPLTLCMPGLSTYGCWVLVTGCWKLSFERFSTFRQFRKDITLMSFNISYYRPVVLTDNALRGGPFDSWGAMVF